jgi:hypothetical protein
LTRAGKHQEHPLCQSCEQEDAPFKGCAICREALAQSSDKLKDALERSKALDTQIGPSTTNTAHDVIGLITTAFVNAAQQLPSYEVKAEEPSEKKSKKN